MSEVDPRIADAADRLAYDGILDAIFDQGFEEGRGTCTDPPRDITDDAEYIVRLVLNRTEAAA